MPWERSLSEFSGDINDIWNHQKKGLRERILFLIDNIQLLHHSAEDARRDAKQWAATSGDLELGVDGDEAETNCIGLVGDASYRSDNVGDATRLIDIMRAASGGNQITSGSKELTYMIRQLCRFQQVALSSPDELHSSRIAEAEVQALSITDSSFNRSIDVPRQSEVKAIKSQQVSASKEIERMIRGIQGRKELNERHEGIDVQVSSGIQGPIVPGTEKADAAAARMSVCVGPTTSYLDMGTKLAADFTLNKGQRVAFLLICRQLDRLRPGESQAATDQHCQFIGGEGGTGKSRVIEALVALFEKKGMSNRIIVTATSGTAAAQINGITIHSACNVSIDSKSRAALSRDIDGIRLASASERFISGPARMDWQDKLLLVIDEISMLGARTLFAVNEQLCKLRGSALDFGGIPIVLFCGDFHQFRPVQERTILLPSEKITWDHDPSFRVEQRHQHDVAHRLWNKFCTVIMLDEQVRAAGDPELQALLTRIRNGVQDLTDLNLLNNRCYREGRRIPWETGITVVTPLNRNRWNLNMEATISFQKQHEATIRIFMSEHKWRGGQPTEEEAIMMLNQGDNSAIPVPAVFLFVPGMPIVVNQNTHQGLKLVNGASYKAVDIVPNKSYPGHQISADIILHFGPPAAILLTSEFTKGLHFAGMPPDTILLAPLTVRIERLRSRPWQQTECSRRGLPCTAAFACTDYKVQGRTLDKIALELRGTRTTKLNGQAVAVGCDPYSLYVQLSRCPNLDGVMLVSKIRERDFIGNKVPTIMTSAIRRLEELSHKTAEDFQMWMHLEHGIGI